MAERTDSLVLLRLVHRALLEAGLPADAILARAGADLARLSDSSRRTPSAAHARFWEVAEQASGDPHIGLHVGEHLPVYRGQVLEYLFTSSPTFGEGLRRALAFHRLLSDAIDGEIVVEGESCFLRGRGSIYATRHSAECLASGLIKFFGSITDGRFRARAIDFVHADGAAPEEYVRVFGCPVTLGAPESRLVFDPALLDYRIWHSEPRLLRLHEETARAELESLRKQDRVAEVRRAIGERLERGDATLEAIAGKLGLSPRRLRTELTDAGTTFQALLEDYRSRLARRLLARTDEPIEQIAYLAGFSEPSTFYRAFKRWTSETPAEFRKKRLASR